MQLSGLPGGGAGLLALSFQWMAGSPPAACVLPTRCTWPWTLSPAQALREGSGSAVTSSGAHALAALRPAG